MPVVKRFTDQYLKNLKPDPKHRREFVETISPLHLIVNPASAGGSKLWAIRWRRNGKRAKGGIGGYPKLGLADARERASDWHKRIDKGEDPRAHRRASVVTGETVRRHAIEYQDQCLPKLQPSTIASHTQHLNAMVDKFGDRLIASVRALELDRFANECETDPTKKKRVDFLRAFFKWAAKRGAVAASPAETLDRPKDKKRTRILSDAELRALWHASPQVSTQHRVKFRLLLLTGARREEAEGVHPSEVNGTAWIVPKERVKLNNGQEPQPHIVPLTPALREVLADVPEAGYKYITGNGLKNALVRKAPGIATDWSLHTLRHTVRTRLHKLGCPRDVAMRLNLHEYDDEAQQKVVDDDYVHDPMFEAQREWLEKWQVALAKIVA
jgi:integrase